MHAASLWLGVVSVGIACSVGLTLGLIAGYFGGWVETVVMRGADMLLAFPSFLLALTILFALGQSIINVMIAVGLASVPGYTRAWFAGRCSPPGSWSTWLLRARSAALTRDSFDAISCRTSLPPSS